MAFYASQIYDLLLGEVDWGSADETAPTPRPGCVQRIARMVRDSMLTSGISLHCQPNLSPFTKGDKTLLPACWSLMFDALSPTDAACTSSMLLEQVGDCIRIDDSNVTGSACNGEIAGNQMALSLVVPSSTKAWRAGTYQPPRLYSFAMPMQGGAVTYGASLVFLRKYVPPAPDTLKSEVQVHAETQQYSIMKSEQNTNVLVATSSTTADNDGVPVLEQQEECSDSSASVPRWFSSTTGILGENQVTRLKVDAGAMLQSLRQWSEEQTAQLSKHGAFLAGDGAGQERPILSHMTSGGRKLLSPLLRAMGVGAGEDSTPSNYSEESAEVAMYGSYSALDYLNMQPQTSTASDSALLPYGLALFSNVPCVETLRTALKTAARECSREWGEEELQAWVRDSLAPVWAKFPKTAPPEAAAEVAWDFSPTAIYELLRPSDLATILAAAVVSNSISNIAYLFYDYGFVARVQNSNNNKSEPLRHAAAWRVDTAGHPSSALVSYLQPSGSPGSRPRAYGVPRTVHFGNCQRQPGDVAHTTAKGCASGGSRHRRNTHSYSACKSTRCNSESRSQAQLCAETLLHSVRQCGC